MPRTRTEIRALIAEHRERTRPFDEKTNPTQAEREAMAQKLIARQLKRQKDGEADLDIVDVLIDALDDLEARVALLEKG